MNEATEVASLRWLPHAEMEIVCHDLSVLNMAAFAHGLVARPRLDDTLDDEACVYQQVEPLAQRPREARGLELWQPGLGLGRRG